MQQPPGGPSQAPYPATSITTELIQKYLDENKQLILAILDNQSLGKLTECAHYQARLQQNLMFLAAIADAQPQAPPPPPPLQQNSAPSPQPSFNHLQPQQSSYQPQPQPFNQPHSQPLGQPVSANQNILPPSGGAAPKEGASVDANRSNSTPMEGPVRNDSGATA